MHCQIRIIVRCFVQIPFAKNGRIQHIKRLVVNWWYHLVLCLSDMYEESLIKEKTCWTPNLQVSYGIFPRRHFYWPPAAKVQLKVLIANSNTPLNVTLYINQLKRRHSHKSTAQALKYSKIHTRFILSLGHNVTASPSILRRSYAWAVGMNIHKTKPK